jgi:hypothetical protein
VADCKATSKNGAVSLDAEWQMSYKRQVEFYQWLLRGQGLTVAPQAWFVYANARKDRDAFAQTLHFGLWLIPYEGDAAWVEPTLAGIHRVLDADRPPAAASDCEYCAFVSRASGY